MTDVSREWRELTQQQQNAWIEAALGVQSRPRLGQYGNLTGEQLYCKINIALLSLGESTVSAPPAYPTFPDLAPTGLVITNSGGTITIKLTCPTDPGEFTIVRATPGVSAGINRPPRVVVLGTAPSPTLGASNITSLYNARYGVPTVGKRIFVAVNQMVNGWEDLWTYYHADVPAQS